MKKTFKIGSRAVSVKLLAAVLILCSIMTGGIVVALMSIGAIQIGYKITPTTTETPTLTPSTIRLDLGSIPSGSSGSKDFGKVATLYLPVGYEITVTLENEFDAFQGMNVHVYLYEIGATYWSYSFYVWMSEYGYNTDSQIVDAGTYDVYVTIDQYSAKSVTSEITGTVEIDISYPG
jgi:hypothetical protein